MKEIIQLAKEQNIKIEYKSRDYIDQKSNSNLHMGVIAYLNPERKNKTLKMILEECEKKNKPPFIIILNGTAPQHNSAAIIRTANAARVDAIVVPKSRSPSLSPEIYRVSMGAAYFTPIIRQGTTSTIKIT